MVWLSGVIVSMSISLVSAMILATFSNVVDKGCSFGLLAKPAFRRWALSNRFFRAGKGRMWRNYSQAPPQTLAVGFAMLW
jgi:hypothetical protein